MKSFKNSNYFTKVEDKYVFRVSTAFWHLLIGIATLAAIVGIFLFLWSVIPSGKDSIKIDKYPDKPKYPPFEKVSLADLHLVEEKSQPSLPLIMDTITIAQPQQQVIIEYDADKPSYDLALLELKKIIPDDQWKPGRWVITNQLGWEMYHSDQYRRWESTGNTMEDYLESIYRVIKAKKYADKKRVLVSVTKIVKQVPGDIKGLPIQNISSSVNSNWSDLKMFDSICAVIEGNVNSFGKKNSNEMIENMIRFGFNNPNTVFEFIPFAIKTVNQFSDSLRSSIFSLLSSSFYSYFNGNIEMQKEATQQFSELIPQLNGYNPTKALRKFYSIYNQKNRKRNDEMVRLMNEYESQLKSLVADSLIQAQMAEVKYNENQSKKNDLRWKSLYVVGGGFIAIALLGTILTLLSIQRILKRIENVAEKEV